MKTWGKLQTLVLGTVLTHALLALMLGILLFTVVDLVETGNRLRNADWALLLLYQVLRLPSAIREMLFLCVPIGCATAIISHCRSRELTAYFSFGASPLRLLPPVVFTGLLFALAVASIIEWGVPESHSRLSALKKELGLPLKRAERMQGQQAWFKTRDGFFHAEQIDHRRGNTATDISFFEMGPDRRVRARLDARSARFAEGRWMGQEVQRTKFTDGQAHPIEHHASAPVPFHFGPAELAASLGTPGKLSWKLLRKAETARRELGQDTTRHLLELKRRITRPLALLVLIFAASFSALTFGPRATATSPVFSAAGLAFLHWFGQEAADALTIQRSISPTFGAWLPTGLLLICSGLICRRVLTGR